MTDKYQKRDRVYKQYWTYLNSSINDILNSMIIGGELNRRLGLFNLFHLLVIMRNENYASCRPTQEEIICMREVLFCNGVDTRIMEAIFPPSYDESDGSEWSDDEISTFDGVDYMAIEGAGILHPINRVR